VVPLQYVPPDGISLAGLRHLEDINEQRRAEEETACKKHHPVHLQETSLGGTLIVGVNGEIHH